MPETLETLENSCDSMPGVLGTLRISWGFPYIPRDQLGFPYIPRDQLGFSTRMYKGSLGLRFSTRMYKGSLGLRFPRTLYTVLLAKGSLGLYIQFFWQNW